MILYHGSPEKIVTPTFGLGEERHDYGKGFYLTADLELAKEWAVCRPETESGYVHTFDFDTKDLFIFDYEKERRLCQDTPTSPSLKTPSFCVRNPPVSKIASKNIKTEP